MTKNETDFAALITRVQAGSEAAVHELIDAYQQPIYNVIRRRLMRRLRSRYDSTDFIQAVFKSFFTNREALCRFDTSEEMIRWLEGMAANKVIDACRRQLAEKRNINRETSLNSERMEGGGDLKANADTPSQVLMAREQIDQLCQGKPPHYRRIIDLRVSGMTYKEVAEKLNMHPGSVRRIMRELANDLK